MVSFTNAPPVTKLQVTPRQFGPQVVCRYPIKAIPHKGTVNMAESSKKNEANAQFAKTQRASDAKQAMAEYETAAAAIRAKTERLKALRLARDAAAPPEAPATAKPKSAGGKKSKFRKSSKPA
ncbi:MAG TPA: hypothetical protein VE396_01010 [Xanthobacteraceae bacterium]|nr:hypothetical protein [Xanthobacteraceae bacterium]